MSTQCPKCHTDNTEDSQFCKKCASPLPQKEEVIPTKTIKTEKEELTTGSIFAGRYKIIEELGKGGMGKVYRVFDQKLNEEVSLKLIKPDIAADKKTIERFKNELFSNLQYSWPSLSFSTITSRAPGFRLDLTFSSQAIGLAKS
jgi:hypothetical protein